MKADYLKVIADQIDDWIAIPTVYLTIDFQPLGGLAEGTQMNRNTGLNGYPGRDIKMMTDNWIFFRDESLADLIESSITTFLENAKTTSYYQSTISWHSTDPMRALDANLVEDGAELYYPSSHGQFDDLKELKAVVDRHNIFHSKMTIPGPSKKRHAEGSGV